jgi:hypothetical protein
MRMAATTTTVCALRSAIPRVQAHSAARQLQPKNDCSGFVAQRYDAQHSHTRGPIPKDSAARRVILLNYGGPAMEGPRLTWNTSQELSVAGPPAPARPVGGPPVQSSPSVKCILEHPRYSGAPQYCLYSSRRPAE